MLKQSTQDELQKSASLITTGKEQRKGALSSRWYCITELKRRRAANSIQYCSGSISTAIKTAADTRRVQGGSFAWQAQSSSAMGIVKALKWAAPSVLTIGALVCGLTAVRLSAEGNFGGCVQCIFCACLLDGLDGHTARALGTSSAFGFELDSLCDLANFGVCPALVVHFWMRSLPEETSNLAQLIGCSFEGCGASLEWAACCCHAGCCALRLARFNVQGHAEQMDNQHLTISKIQKPPVSSAIVHNMLQRKMYFEGLPAPMGAAWAMFPITLSLSSKLTASLGAVGEAGAWAVGRRGAAATLFVTALLMVSSLPTLSSKMLKPESDSSHFQSRNKMYAILKPLMAGAVLLAVWGYPFETFLTLVVLHAISLPAGLVLFYGMATAALQTRRGKMK